MALDTNLTPEIVNSFNVYIDGVKAIGTAPEITLPQITSETIDVSGAGILGKISAPNIGQFESIEQEVSFNLVYSSFFSPKGRIQNHQKGGDSPRHGYTHECRFLPESARA